MSGPRIFVLSVHFKEDYWVGVQRHFLDLTLRPTDRRLFARFEISDEVFLPSETVVEWDDGKHATALNLLGQLALEEADPDDWLLFLDSDAWPLLPVEELLTGYGDILAVQRLENLGDPQPHPCFTLVRARRWRELEGDWNRGESEFMWLNDAGDLVGDVGGKLLARIEETGTPWEPLRRLNTEGLHTLWFGVYGTAGGLPVTYHHGAGSRIAQRGSRLDYFQLAQSEAARRARVGARLDFCDKRRLAALGLTRDDVLTNYPGRWEDGVRALMERDDAFWRELMRPAGGWWRVRRLAATATWRVRQQGRRARWRVRRLATKAIRQPRDSFRRD